MVKRAFPFLFFVVFLGVLLNGCSPTFCSTPYILSNGDCCLDKNADDICDQQQDLYLNEREEYASAQPQEERNLSSGTPSPKTTREGIIYTVSADDDPFLGNPDADVVLVEFGDYVDKNSQRFQHELLPQLLELYGTKIKYVYRNYPAVSNQYAQLAAEASECAREQDKFWEYHELLFANTYHITPSNIYRFAEEIGLNIAQFSQCLTVEKYRAEVEHDRADGSAANVPYTPTFFINNKRVVGFKTLDKFKEIFDELFYDDVRLERGTTITARSSTDAYRILEGPAVLEDQTPLSPYSNRLEVAEASFVISAQDLTPRDGPTSLDVASLNVTYVARPSTGFLRDAYRIALTSLLSEGVSHSYFGGVATDISLYGNTGIGTRYLPRTRASLALWGLADIYQNDRLVASDQFVHFVIVQGIRDEHNNILQHSEETDVEAYLLVSGKDHDNSLSFFDGGYLYLFWPDVNLRQEI